MFLFLSAVLRSQHRKDEILPHLGVGFEEQRANRFLLRGRPVRQFNAQIPGRVRLLICKNMPVNVNKNTIETWQGDFLEWYGANR